MGGVSRTPPGPRGQLIIVGAVLLGLLLVGLAVVVNSAIFAENLATRQNDAGESDVTAFRGAVTTGVEAAIESTNRVGAGDDFTQLRDGRYEPRVAALASRLKNRQSLTGSTVDLTPVDSRPGTQLVDDDPSTDVTPRGGTPVDWTMATGTHVRAFDLRLTPAESTTATDQLTGGSGDAFLVELAATGGPTHQVAVYEVDGGSTTARVAVSEVGSGTVRECSAAGPMVNVSLTGRPTVDGEYCRALASVGASTGTYDVRVENGDRATGTYRLTVDRLDDAGSAASSLDEQVDRANYGLACSGDRTYYDTTADSPYSLPAIYAGTVELGYRSQQATSDQTLRLAPDQAGDALVTPLVTSLSVSDTSADGDAALTVDWTVGDPNGDLDSVTVAVTDRDGDDDASDTTDVEDASASGSFAFSDSGGETNEYDVTVTVTDGTNSRSRTVRHTADSDGTGCPA